MLECVDIVLFYLEYLLCLARFSKMKDKTTFRIFSEDVTNYHDRQPIIN